MLLRRHVRLSLFSIGFIACATPRSTPAPAPVAEQPLVEPAVVSQVEIRRTEYGVPHITAESFAALGFGLAYCQLEDYGDRVVMGLARAQGEWGIHFGRDSIDQDFAARQQRQRAFATYHLLSQDARDLYEGFAEGVNWYVRLHRDEFPAWVEPSFTGHDVHARFIQATSQSVIDRFVRRLSAAEEDADVGDEGSNAWAFGPSRTVSGHAILLRNPHLSWTAGYYEVQLIVPGRLNFYGDVRIGYPLYYLGGFNEHLGWATTNNYPDLDEVYALDVDPSRPDHYLFDGGSVPLTHQLVTVEFSTGNGVGAETREFWTTPLGPVIHRGNGKIYVMRDATDGEYRMVDQYLGIMQASNLDEWLEAMRIRAHESSNFTYADDRGNIHYLWNARLPSRPHDPGGDTIAISARRSSDIWTHLVPFDSLPRLLNPIGGYLQNENDPFYFTNLNQPFDPAAYSSNYPRPRLRLRSQLALALIHETEHRLTLEDVIALKHTTRMLVAERVKDDLVKAVRATDPHAELREAIDLVDAWDARTDPESRGAMLFEVWFRRYVALDQEASGRSFSEAMDSSFAVPWSVSHPVTTPYGLRDPARAVQAFGWAVAETARLFGSWDVAWGDVHRVRRGAVDVPVGGCTGTLGCFRTLSFTRAEDGKLVASTGDAWVLAVEFGETPRAYSVLAYGESDRPDSPHYGDQAQMFAEGRLKRVAFTEEEIEAALIRRYRPGREVRPVGGATPP